MDGSQTDTEDEIRAESRYTPIYFPCWVVLYRVIDIRFLICYDAFRKPVT
jgi:hypothetical protein